MPRARGRRRPAGPPNPRPHVFGVDDGPVEKRPGRSARIVGVMMEGADLVESIAVTEFAVDGEDATGFLGEWIAGLRMRPALHAVVLGGITIAGLGVVDIEALAARLRTAVVAVNRKDPTRNRLADAFVAAGLSGRLEVLRRTPPAFQLARGLWLSHAGTDAETAAALVRATLRKAQLPEPLRVAHLVARALETGESRGRA